MCCINQIGDLFAEPTRCAAVCLAAVSFVAGAVFACLLCKLRRSCGKKPCVASASAASAPRPQPEKRHPAPADGSIEIYVGNLSYDMTDDQLRKEFEAYGKVNSAHIIVNRYTNKSKGFGFVHMPNADEVDAAVKALSDKEILGRRIKCNVARNVDR